MATDVLSALTGFRHVPLDELDDVLIDEALGRILPEVPAAPGAAFQSAI